MKKKIGKTKIVFDEEVDIILDGSKPKQSAERQNYEIDEEETPPKVLRAKRKLPNLIFYSFPFYLFLPYK